MLKKLRSLIFSFNCGFQESQKTKSQAQQLNTETNEKLVLCEKELEKLHKDIESLEETKKSELEFLVCLFKFLFSKFLFGYISQNVILDPVMILILFLFSGVRIPIEITRLRETICGIE